MDERVAVPDAAIEYAGQFGIGLHDSVLALIEQERAKVNKLYCDLRRRK